MFGQISDTNSGFTCTSLVLIDIKIEVLSINLQILYSNRCYRIVYDMVGGSPLRATRKR